MANSSSGVVVSGPLQGKRKLEDTKGVIRSREPKKGRQCNGQKKRTKRQTMIYKNITQKNKDRATRTPLQSGGGGELRCPEELAIPVQHVTPIVLLKIPTKLMGVKDEPDIILRRKS
jgi:hypothetical protein